MFLKLTDITALQQGTNVSRQLCELGVWQGSRGLELALWSEVSNHGTSDVKRGQNLEAEADARATRPRQDQFLEVEAKAEAKTNYEKVPNNE